MKSWCNTIKMLVLSLVFVMMAGRDGLGQAQTITEPVSPAKRVGYAVFNQGVTSLTVTAETKAPNSITKAWIGRQAGYVKRWSRHDVAQSIV